MKCVAVSLDPFAKQTLTKLMSAEELLQREWDLEKLSEEVLDPAPDMAIVGQAPEGQTLIEMAQLMRMNYPAALIYYVTSERSGIDRKILEKNGFNSVYIVPFESKALEDAILNSRAKTGGTQKSYKKVKLIDVAPGEALDFDTSLYLPMNDKYITFSTAGQVIDESRAKRLQTHKVASLYVDRAQMPKFYSYTASRLKSLGNANFQMSETERKERLEQSVRDLFGGLFEDGAQDNSFDSGKKMAADCQEIVKAYLGGSKPDDKNSWYAKFLEAAQGTSEAYSEAVNVSTYAGLFSIGLAIGVPENVTIAALLHNIGKTDLPAEIQNKPVDYMTPEELAIYQRYPELTVNLIKNRKMAVSENIMKMIMQHQERYDGSGFPAKLSGTKVMPEAQLIAVAIEFNVLTSGSNQARVTPLQAVDILKQRTRSTPPKVWYDPALLNKVLALFPSDV